MDHPALSAWNNSYLYLIILGSILIAAIAGALFCIYETGEQGGDCCACFMAKSSKKKRARLNWRRQQEEDLGLIVVIV
jgi:hypothetical protein